MSVQAEPILTPPTSAMQNIIGKGNEQTLENPNMPVSDAALREYYDKHYHQLLPLIAKKVHQEKTQQDKLKEVKARLNFEGLKKEVYTHARVTPEHNDTGTSKGKRKAATKVPVQGKRNPFPESVTTKRRLHKERKRSQKVKIAEEDTESQGRKNKSQALNKTTYPNHGCKSGALGNANMVHVFNSTLTGTDRVWFDELPPESMDSYDDLKKAFLVNFLQQKKCIKDPVEIHHIKQKEGESTEDFVQRFKSESRHVKGAPECMRISGFMHGITNPELIKRLYNNISKSVDEMMRATTAFLREEVAASNQARKKTLPA
ncbi:reverse transcriptase domain-containing protein [Tanacetum coccineum]